MPTIREEDINAVREKADIVDVIGHYLQVQRKGKSYVALCPFHDDHSPSMSISQDKQIYKCFVCNAGGNVFSFVQNYEKISFPEAVGRVASLVGYPLTITDSYQQKKVDPHKETLYKLLNEAIKFFMYELNSEEAKQEKEYLEKRGLDQATRERFQIGYNPKGDKLYAFLKAKGYHEKDMVACNLIRTAEDGLHDVFYGRITFPIHDKDGNPIGFSARSLDANTTSKYINTNETELFEKGKLLFNYHRARNQARKEKEVYIAEGVTDVIAFQKAGIENCVCTLGTACTKQQIQQLKQLAPTVVFCYDGDDAGQNATYKAARLAKDAGIDVLVVNNKTGKDPDEILREQDKEGLINLSKNTIPWMEFVIQYHSRKVNMDNYLEKKEFVQKTLTEIQALEDPLDRQHYSQVLSQLTGFTLDLEQPSKPVTPIQHKVSSKIPNGAKEAEEAILYYMLQEEEASHDFETNLGFLNDRDRNELALMIVDAYRTQETIDAMRLMDSTKNEEIKKLIASLLAEEEKPNYTEAIMHGLARKVKIYAKTKEADGYKEQLEQDLNEVTQQLVLTKYHQCLTDLRRYIDEDNEN